MLFTPRSSTCTAPWQGTRWALVSISFYTTFCMLANSFHTDFVMNKLIVALAPSFRMPPFNAPLTGFIPHSLGALQPMGSQRVRHNLVTEHCRRRQQQEGASLPQALRKRLVAAGFNKTHAQTCVHPPAEPARSSPALRGRRGGSPSWAASPSPAGRSPRWGPRTPPALGGRTVWTAGPAGPSATYSSSRALSPTGEVGQGLGQSPRVPCSCLRGAGPCTRAPCIRAHRPVSSSCLRSAQDTSIRRQGPRGAAGCLQAAP